MTALGKKQLAVGKADWLLTKRGVAAF